MNIDLLLRIQGGDMSVLTDAGVVCLAVYRLVKLGLVQMIGDLPILTSAGADIIGEDDF
ncbi:MAG: hypothetical protein WKF57_03635 [Nakamurella sp.]